MNCHFLIMKKKSSYKNYFICFFLWFLCSSNSDCTCWMTSSAVVGFTVFSGRYSDNYFLFQRRVKFYKRICWMLCFFSLWTCLSPWNTQAFMNPLQHIWSRWVLRTTVFINKLQKLHIRLNAHVAFWLKFIRRCGNLSYKIFSAGKFLSFTSLSLW